MVKVIVTVGTGAAARACAPTSRSIVVASRNELMVFMGVFMGVQMSLEVSQRKETMRNFRPKVRLTALVSWLGWTVGRSAGSTYSGTRCTTASHQARALMTGFVGLVVLTGSIT